jgi:hypothetical protein
MLDQVGGGLMDGTDEFEIRAALLLDVCSSYRLAPEAS